MKAHSAIYLSSTFHKPLTRSKVWAPSTPAVRIPLGPSSKIAPSGPRIERIQPPRRLLPSTRTTWQQVGDTVAVSVAGIGDRGGPRPRARIHLIFVGNIRVLTLGGFQRRWGTHLWRAGASAQIITGGQATDASAQYDHGTAHQKAWGKRAILTGKLRGALHSRGLAVPRSTLGHLVIRGK